MAILQRFTIVSHGCHDPASGLGVMCCKHSSWDFPKLFVVPHPDVNATFFNIVSTKLRFQKTELGGPYKSAKDIITDLDTS